MTNLSLPTITRVEPRPLSGKQANRSHATKRLDQEMERARQEAGYQFSAVLVHFEGLSDSAHDQLGYAAGGDDVWRRAMEFLTQDLRAVDLCCRLSTDEFVLILSAQGQSEAGTLVDWLRDRWQPPPGSRQADIQLNIGIASYPTHGCRVEELLRAADEALDADRLHNELLRAAQPRRITISH
jgi:diguanylate cyclase (GGDEF)-like protein